MVTEKKHLNITPGKMIDQIANRIASLKSKLGNVEKHKMGGALTGRKRFLLERTEEMERLAGDFGVEFKRRVISRVADLLKDDDED